MVSQPFFQHPRHVSTGEFKSKISTYLRAILCGVNRPQDMLQACQGPHSHLMILVRHTENQQTWPEPRHFSSIGEPTLEHTRLNAMLPS